MTLLTKRACSEKWEPIEIKCMEANAINMIRSTGNWFVIAGPGAGKTELLAQRAAYLLQTGAVPEPCRILAISFKRDSATNLAARVRKRCHGSHFHRFHSMTFDAFAKRLVDRFGSMLPDRWRPRPDYEIILTDKKMFEGFLNRKMYTIPPDIGTCSDFESIAPGKFEHQHLCRTRLPEEGWADLTPAQWAVDQFWQEHLHEQIKTQLSFPMIERLAELLVRLNPIIGYALRLTYSHLFMDEFQDTTQAQYDLVQSIFLDSDAHITAVGDNKQQIMRWAGAMCDPFHQFKSDFCAQRRQLGRNYRSSPNLVKIQNVFARTLDSEAVESISKANADPRITGKECEIWKFQTTDFEANKLAEFVTNEMNTANLLPQDFAILVRQKAENYMKTLEPAFKKKNILVRNEAEKVEGVVLQYLHTEKLSKLLIMILRIAMAPPAGRYWSKCQETISVLRGIDLDNTRLQIVLADELQKFSIYLHNRYSSPPATECEARALVNCILNFIGHDQLIAAHPAYAQGGRLEEVAMAAAVHLCTSSATASNWIKAIETYEGLHAVPLMTIHKSKGLEYHTVIFVGLENMGWWSFPLDEHEGLASFFVALSRAKQRAIFTYCKKRGRCNKIKRIYNLLQEASVFPIDMERYQ